MKDKRKKTIQKTGSHHKGTKVVFGISAAAVAIIGTGVTIAIMGQHTSAETKGSGVSSSKKVIHIDQKEAVAQKETQKQSQDKTVSSHKTLSVKKEKRSESQKETNPDKTTIRPSTDKEQTIMVDVQKKPENIPKTQPSENSTSKTNAVSLSNQSEADDGQDMEERTNTSTQKLRTDSNQTKSKTNSNTPTEETKYLPTSQAQSILTKSGVFQKLDNEYVLQDDWGYVVDVKVDKDHIGFIYFDGTTYNAAKDTSYSDVLAVVEGNRNEADTQWAYLQGIITNTEKAVRASADALYGQGTKESDALYDAIMKGGETSNGYFREF